MYRYTEETHNSSEDFDFPTGMKLDPNNRWVILASLIPWSKFEAEYAANFDEKIGAPAKSFRMALGALIIQEILRTTDSETIEHIKENHYLQYFLRIVSIDQEYIRPIVRGKAGKSVEFGAKVSASYFEGNERK